MGKVDTVEAGTACVSCGYDLRTLPVYGRCPECGAPVRQSLPKRRSPLTAAERSQLSGAGRALCVAGVLGAVMTLALLLAAAGPWRETFPPPLRIGSACLPAWGIFAMLGGVQLRRAIARHWPEEVVLSAADQIAVFGVAFAVASMWLATIAVGRDVHDWADPLLGMTALAGVAASWWQARLFDWIACARQLEANDDRPPRETNTSRLGLLRAGTLAAAATVWFAILIVADNSDLARAAIGMFLLLGSLWGGLWLAGMSLFASLVAPRPPGETDDAGPPL